MVKTISRLKDLLKTSNVMIKYHLYKDNLRLKISYSLVDPEYLYGQKIATEIQIAKDLKFYKNSLHDGDSLKIFVNGNLYQEVIF